ncbi:MAG: hypothetical protein JXR14_11425 [Paracoccaceae bacterium]
MSTQKEATEMPGTGAMAEKTRQALASIEAKNRKREAASYSVIGGAMAYGSASLGEGRFGRISSAAKWFCIWFAMILPVLMFAIHV